MSFIIHYTISALESGPRRSCVYLNTHQFPEVSSSEWLAERRLKSIYEDDDLLGQESMFTGLLGQATPCADEQNSLESVLCQGCKQDISSFVLPPQV